MIATVLRLFVENDTDFLNFGQDNSQQKLLTTADWLSFNKSLVGDYNGGGPEQQYSQLVQVLEVVGDLLTTYYTPVLVVGGFVGNILSVIVFFKTNLRKLSSSYYLAALAISDSCFLLGLFAGWLSFFNINIYNREIFCQIFTFLSFLSSFCSVWFVVAFTVERFIAIIYPLKRQTMCTVRRAKIVLLCITLAGIIHSLPSLFFAKPEYNYRLNETICDIRSEIKDIITTWNFIDTIVVFVIPFTTIVVLNSRTAFSVWKFASQRRSMIMQRHTSNGTKSPATGRTNSVRRNNSMGNRSQSGERGGRNQSRSTSTRSRPKNVNSTQTKVTKMLLIVSSVFICLNLPSYIMRVYTYLETDAPRWMVITQYFALFLFNTSFGINFGLYCVSGKNFRKAVCSLLSGNKRRRMEATQQITLSENIRNSANRGRNFRRSTRRARNQCHDFGELQDVVTNF